MYLNLESENTITGELLTICYCWSCCFLSVWFYRKAFWQKMKLSITSLEIPNTTFCWFHFRNTSLHQIWNEWCSKINKGSWGEIKNNYNIERFSTVDKFDTLFSFSEKNIETSIFVHLWKYCALPVWNMTI